MQIGFDRHKRIAALVNDFGSINVDAAPMREHAAEALELTGGCLCCSAANDFAEALEQVQAQTTNPDGGASVAGQPAGADLAPLNKSDLVAEDALADVADLADRLEQFVPAASQGQTVDAALPPAQLLAAHRGQAEPRADTAARDRGQLFEAWSVARPGALTRDDVERFAQGLGDKGFICLAGDRRRHHLFQQVGQRRSLQPLDETAADALMSLLAVVGRHGATDVERLFDLLGEMPWPIDPAPPRVT